MTNKDGLRHGSSKENEKKETEIDGTVDSDNHFSAPRDRAVVEATESMSNATEAIGDHIGPYKVLEQLGEGGMGAVYLAEQRQPVNRRVALKIIKAGMDSGQVIARFEAERQALAMMDHAHIARVYDAGTTNAGRPFFAMELVRGTPITKFCDDHKLGIHERLELFGQVCSAVQHAHQKGVIHRDLKPSNILVSLQDDKPVSKVIDFGLAKATNQQLTEKTMFTAHGQVLGTLEYMSPEQAHLNDLDVDTRSDIYSLGVILYELLTGSTPLKRESLREAGFMEILNRIREEEPERPSSRISESVESLESISSVRQIEPRRFSALMKGDLDWIVLKAMEKDRSRRYETANGFAADIRRYLADELIEARPPSAGYRMSKLIRKNRVAVVFAATIALLLVVGIGVSSYLAIWAMHEASIARAASVRANAERKKAFEAQTASDEQRKQALAAKTAAEASERQATQVLEIVTDSFQTIDPGDGEGYDMLASEVLKRAYGELDTKLADDPLARAALLHTFCKAFHGLGENELSLAAGQEAIRIRQEELGDQDLQTLDSMRALCWSLKAAGSFAEMMDLAIRTNELCRNTLGEDHPDTLKSMHNLAIAYYVNGDLERAMPLYEETLKKTRDKLGEDHPDTLRSMGNLALAYRANGEVDKAISLQEETLGKQRANLGEDHPDTLSLMNNLAVAYGANGEPDKATLLYEETLKKRKSKLGEDHPDTLLSMGNLANAYRANGEVDKAISLQEETLKKTKDNLGEEHHSTLRSMHDLALAYQANGDLERAIRLHEETLKKRKAKLGEDHPDTLTSMHNLVVAYYENGDLDRSTELCEETLKKRKARLGEDHPDTLSSMDNLAIAYKANDNLIKAIPLYEERLEITKTKLGDDHPDTLSSMGNLAKAYKDNHELDKAIPLYEETLQKRKAKLGEDHADVASTLSSLAIAYSKSGDKLKAAEFFHQAEQVRLKNFQGDMATIKFLRDASTLAHNQAMMYREAKEPTHELECLRRAIEHRAKALENDGDNLDDAKKLDEYCAATLKLAKSPSVGKEHVTFFQQTYQTRLDARRRLVRLEPEIARHRLLLAGVLVDSAAYDVQVGDGAAESLVQIDEGLAMLAEEESSVPQKSVALAKVLGLGKKYSVLRSLEQPADEALHQWFAAVTDSEPQDASSVLARFTLVTSALGSNSSTIDMKARLANMALLQEKLQTWTEEYERKTPDAELDDKYKALKQAVLATLLNSRAWALATTSDATLRDGKQAIELATQAVELSNDKSKPIYLDTLAAAHAEADDFPMAIKVAEQAIDLCQDEEVAEALKKSLKSFQNQEPIRE